MAFKPVEGITRFGAAEAKAFIEEKQQLEINLAERMVEEFAKPANNLIQPLREYALDAILTMCLGDSAKVQAAINDEKAMLDLLKKQRAFANLPGKPVKGIDLKGELEALIDEADTFTPAEVSDIIRLYGTYVEKAAKGDGATAEQKLLDRLKSEARTIIGQNESVWKTGKEKGRDKATEGRHREAIADKLNGVDYINELRKKSKNSERFSTFLRAIVDDAFERVNGTKPSETQHRLMMKAGGQSNFVLNNTSTISQIDRIFGLVPAADISGTTADTIFFLRRMSEKTELDPLVYLLPVGTIVAGAHHSLLEVAAPLTGNKIIDYQIGFYLSLLPKAKSKYVNAAAAIFKLLAEFEKSPKNRHMLVWYDYEKWSKVANLRALQSSVGGCYVIDPKKCKQIDKYRKMASVEFMFDWCSGHRAETTSQEDIHALMVRGGLAASA